MNKQFICLPSENNKFTHIFSERNVLKYIYSRDIVYDIKLDYFDAHIVSDDLICSRDMCLITDPYGSAYTEVCASIDFIDDRYIFKGVNGTRCLLRDVKKIAETTNIDLQTEEIMPINEATLITLIEESNYEQEDPDFF